MSTRMAALVVIWGVACGSEPPPSLEDYRGPATPAPVHHEPPPPQERPRQVLSKPIHAATEPYKYLQDLNGPAPREILRSMDMPTEAEIVNEVAARFAEPALLRAVPQVPDRGLTVWNLSYGGIPVMTDARTSLRDGEYTTRWIPAERGPDLQRDKLIGAERARASTGAKTKSDETGLFFQPVFGLRMLHGHKSEYGVADVRVISRYKLLYEVRLIDDTIVHVDAYTGDLVAHYDPRRDSYRE